MVLKIYCDFQFFLNTNYACVSIKEIYVFLFLLFTCLCADIEKLIKFFCYNSLIWNIRNRKEAIKFFYIHFTSFWISAHKLQFYFIFCSMDNRWNYDYNCLRFSFQHLYSIFFISTSDMKAIHLTFSNFIHFIFLSLKWLWIWSAILSFHSHSW